MSRPSSSSTALPIAYVVLRILIVVNWLMGAGILALLVVMPNHQWIMSAFKLSPSPDAERVVMGMRAVSVADSQPVASNKTEEGRAKNRRIEIRLRPVAPEEQAS